MCLCFVFISQRIVGRRDALSSARIIFIQGYVLKTKTKRKISKGELTSTILNSGLVHSIARVCVRNTEVAPQVCGKDQGAEFSPRRRDSYGTCN